MINRFPCTRCTTNFDSMLEFRDHTIDSHFNGDLYEEFKYYTCLTCEDTSQSKELSVKHIDQHHEEAKDRIIKLDTGNDTGSRKQYVCPECGEMFDAKLDLVEHAFGYHPKSQELHKKFMNLFQLKYLTFVIPASDGQEPINEIKSDDSHSGSKELEVNNKFTCANPNDFAFDSDKIKNEIKEEIEITDEEQFETEHNNPDIQYFRRLNEKVVQSDIMKSFDKLEPMIDTREESPVEITQNSDKVKCALCDQTFNNSLELKTHGKVHESSSRNGVMCTFCPKQFSKLQDLRRHLPSHVKEPQKFICLVRGCKFSSPNNNEVKLHWLKTHKDQSGDHNPKLKELQCDICQKIFNYKELLVNHKALKHAEKKNSSIKISKRPVKVEIKSKTQPTRMTFSCQLCGKVYFKYSNCLQHQKTVHLNLNNFKNKYFHPDAKITIKR